MSYSICRILKIKSSGVTGIQIHDRREKQFSHTNKDIDFNKSSQNIDLVNQNEKFRQVIQQRIESLNLKRKPRKDATVMVQVMLTSDNDFFKEMTKTQQLDFFEKSFMFIQDKYGKENVISATIHFDETTPHMHVNFVPVTKDNRLSARDLFSPKLLRELQTEYNDYVNLQGYELERGKRDSKKKGLSVEEFKLATKENKLKSRVLEVNTQNRKVNDQVLKINEKKQIIKNEVNELIQTREKLDCIRVDFDKLKPLNGKYGLLNKQKVTVDVNEFEEFRKIAQKCILNARDFEKQLNAAGQQIKNLQIENQNLIKENSKFEESKQKSLDDWKNLISLQSDISLLKSKNNGLNEEMNCFDDFLKSKDMIQEYINFKELIEYEFENDYDYER